MTSIAEFPPPGPVFVDNDNNDQERATMPWLMVLPVFGLGWWFLGFPPGGWLVTPIIPTMPVNAGELVVLGTVVLGMWGGLVWLRNNL